MKIRLQCALDILQRISQQVRAKRGFVSNVRRFGIQEAC
jgi:hypothetical protein